MQLETCRAKARGCGVGVVNSPEHVSDQEEVETSSGAEACAALAEE